MRVQSIFVENYRPFKVLEEMRLGPLATIVGQNDVGKSNILRALQLFFESKPKIEDSDVYDGANSDDDIVIEEITIEIELVVLDREPRHRANRLFLVYISAKQLCLGFLDKLHFLYHANNDNQCYYEPNCLTCWLKQAFYAVYKRLQK